MYEIVLFTISRNRIGRSGEVSLEFPPGENDVLKFPTMACGDWRKFYEKRDLKYLQPQIITLEITIIWYMDVRLYGLFLFKIVQNIHNKFNV